MISIDPKQIKPTAAKTFDEVQVGDDLIVWNYGNFRGYYTKHTITRVTPKQFACGIGTVTDGKYAYEHVYRKSDGRKLGDILRSDCVRLATPENIAQVAQHFDEDQRLERTTKAFAELTTAIEKRGRSRHILDADQITKLEAAVEALMAVMG